MAMKFTVTSRVGFTEVVDRPESATAALERVLIGVELRRICAGWQPEKLRCCPMNQG